MERRVSSVSRPWVAGDVSKALGARGLEKGLEGCERLSQVRLYVPSGQMKPNG